MTRTGRTATRGTPQEQLLRSLRARLLSSFVVVATFAVAAFGAGLVTWDARLASGRLDTELRGAASRAAALVYLDDNGSTKVDGITDDEVAGGEFRIVVSARTLGEILLDTAPSGSDNSPLPSPQIAAAALPIPPRAARMPCCPPRMARSERRSCPGSTMPAWAVG